MSLRIFLFTTNHPAKLVDENISVENSSVNIVSRDFITI